MVRNLSLLVCLYKTSYVVQALSIDVFNCPFNSIVLHKSLDMGILLALQLFECILSCCFIWHGNGTNIAVRPHEMISWFWLVSFPNMKFWVSV